MNMYWIHIELASLKWVTLNSSGENIAELTNERTKPRSTMSFFSHSKVRDSHTPVYKIPRSRVRFSWKSENGQCITDLPFNYENRFVMSWGLYIVYNPRVISKGRSLHSQSGLLPSWWEFLPHILPLCCMTSNQLSRVAVDACIVDEFERHILISIELNVHAASMCILYCLGMMSEQTKKRWLKRLDLRWGSKAPTTELSAPARTKIDPIVLDRHEMSPSF